MSKTIRTPGGVSVRVLEAINGFRTKYGYWPTQIEAEAGTITALATHHLTPLGFYLLQSKIEIAEGPMGQLFAKGRDGDIFNYGEEGWRGEHEHDARAWIGLEVEDEA